MNNVGVNNRGKGTMGWCGGPNVNMVSNQVSGIQGQGYVGGHI